MENTMYGPAMVNAAGGTLLYYASCSRCALFLSERYTKKWRAQDQADSHNSRYHRATV